MLINNYKTERLILRDVVKDDAQAVWKIWSNKNNDKYMSDPVESLDEVKAICIENEDINKLAYLTVIALQKTNEIIGTCCFGQTNKVNIWGFGYSINHKFWGNGYATEVVKAIIEIGKSKGATDFVSDCVVENIASKKVMEKNGMVFDHKSSFKQKYTGLVYETLCFRLHIE